MSDTDYLIIGAGASGLAFADAMVEADPEAELTLVDRRPGPGGHWLDAYPFVRLHTPSAYYGVDSLPLGEDRIDETGENAGFYERATGAEVRDYFAEVAERLEGTGRVRFVYGRERVPGDETGYRRKLVDARYLEVAVPATHEPSFEVADGANVIPVNDLPDKAGEVERFAVFGAGKTAVDAAMWLLDEGVDPDRISWVRPREHWFHHRRHFQPLDLVGDNMGAIADDAEAAAGAADVDDLFKRLEAAGRVVRLDPSKPASMYRVTMLSDREIEALRSIEDVVNLGHVRKVEADRLVLELGEVGTSRDVLHVDCTAEGLRHAPPVPVFQGDRIVLQQVRQNSPSFNAAITALIEATRDDEVEMNRLTPPNPYPRSTEDWPAVNRRTWSVEREWLQAPDLARWINSTRLNLLRGLPEQAGEPAVQESVRRFLTHVGPASERLRELENA